jgi:lysophospholipase L1-like esterase
VSQKLLILFVFVFCYVNSLIAQEYIFYSDSDNSTYYDPSYLFQTSPSELLRVNTNKFPVDITTYRSGKNSLKLQWKSVTGGDWGAAIAAPGWPGRDVTIMDSLSFWVYSNSIVPAASLPKIYLEDLSNQKSAKINLSEFQGDVPSTQWINIKIPVKKFIDNPGNADLTRIKTIFFGQGSADNQQHTLFLDDIKMTGSDSNQYKFVVVLGSSTAAGTGANPIDSSWVNKFRKNLQMLDSTYKVMNLAVGGYTTYDVMPTGFVPPAGRPLPKQYNNISYGLTFNPVMLLVNLPSNDAANYYPITEQIRNYDTLISVATRNNIDIFITSPQPRNFTNAAQMNLLLAMVDSSFTRYNNVAVDYWNGVAQSNGFIKPEYNSGDGIHLNNAGHQKLYERMSQKVFPVLVYVNEMIARTELNFQLNYNYPNPFNPGTTISFTIPYNTVVNLSVYNILGEKVTELYNDEMSPGEKKIVWNGLDDENKKVSSGIYIYRISTPEKTLSGKMILQK